MNAHVDYTTWAEQNQQYLVTKWRAVQCAIEDGNSPSEAIDFSESELILDSMKRPPSLVTLAKIFSLSEFEQFIILLCAGYEMDSQLALAFNSTPYSAPCFALALSLYRKSHWSALTPIAPLRHWRLIEVNKGENLLKTRLHIDERITHYLSGISYLDLRLSGLVERAKLSPELTPSLNECAEQIIKYWSVQKHGGQALLVQVCGLSEADMQAVARKACEKLELIPYCLKAHELPLDHEEREALSILWQREALLDHAVLIVSAGKKEQETVNRFIRNLATPCIVIAQQPLNLESGAGIRIDLPQPDSTEQLVLWRSALGDSAQHFNGGLEHIVSQFCFSAHEIASLSQHALSAEQPNGIEQCLWQQCRSHSRRQLEGLAERIESAHQWNDLVMPEVQKESLYDIVGYARHRHQVYGDWKFGAKSKRGQGGSCLFYGPSGTGKTMAASVISNELQLDLYHVDLSQVINKYIGETEKNIARIFDIAENSGAILLFDEADSLFAKRTEVKSSNDRNANIGTSYLLQRMESYSGLAILTTNLKREMDSAFMRRIRFATQFTFPDPVTRLKIWTKMFPAEILVEKIDLVKLANLEVAGGNIRNIALNAAFYAAGEGNVIGMQHLAKAALREFSKLDKPIRESELRGWG